MCCFKLLFVLICKQPWESYTPPPRLWPFAYPPFPPSLPLAEREDTHLSGCPVSLVSSVQGDFPNSSGWAGRGHPSPPCFLRLTKPFTEVPESQIPTVVLCPGFERGRSEAMRSSPSWTQAPCFQLGWDRRGWSMFAHLVQLERGYGGQGHG